MSHYDLVSPEQPYTPELARAKLADIENHERERGRGRSRLDEAEELERLRPKTAPPPQAPPQQQVFAAYPGGYWNYPPQPTVAVKQPHRKHASYAIASSSTQNLPQIPPIHRPTPTYAYPHPAAPPPPVPQFPQNHNHKHTHTRHVSLSAARANTYPQTIPQQKITQVTVGHPPNPTPPPHSKGFIPPAYYTSGNGNPMLGGSNAQKKPFFKRMFSIFGPTRPQTSMGFHGPHPQVPLGVAPLPEPRRNSRDQRRRSKSSHRREDVMYSRRDRRDSF